MPQKRPMIKDIAVVGTGYIPLGEAPGRGDSKAPITALVRQNMISRLESSVKALMDEANKSHRSEWRQNPSRITRLSTNEFFFYTKEPLTLEEFEGLQNRIAEKAKTLPSAIQLILGSFCVKTEDSKVVNVTPHISCGPQPEFHFLIKNNTSEVDVRYKDHVTGKALAMLDMINPSLNMPQITISGTTKTFTFNNIVPCKTPGGASFLTAVDICLDHHYGIAKINHEYHAAQHLPLSHVVISNWTELSERNCLETNVMHVDPECSPRGCKKGIQQKEGPARKLAFGKDKCKIYEVKPVAVYTPNPANITHSVNNKYAYKARHNATGRSHEYNASIETTVFQQSKSRDEFKEFRLKYKEDAGDRLKTKILNELKKQIEMTHSRDDLDTLKNKIKSSYEYDILKTGQGWFTRKTGIKTSSVRALEDMFKQQEENIDDATPPSLK